MRVELDKLPGQSEKRVLEVPNYYYEKGYGIGFKKGLEEAEEGVIQEWINKMQEKGSSDEFIADVSGWSISKVREMRKKLNDSDK